MGGTPEDVDDEVVRNPGPVARDQIDDRLAHGVADLDPSRLGGRLFAESDHDPEIGDVDVVLVVVMELHLYCRLRGLAVHAELAAVHDEERRQRRPDELSNHKTGFCWGVPSLFCEQKREAGSKRDVDEWQGHSSRSAIRNCRIQTRTDA